MFICLVSIHIGIFAPNSPTTAPNENNNNVAICMYILLLATYIHTYVPNSKYVHLYLCSLHAATFACGALDARIPTENYRFSSTTKYMYTNAATLADMVHVDIEIYIQLYEQYIYICIGIGMCIAYRITPVRMPLC